MIKLTDLARQEGRPVGGFYNIIKSRGLKCRGGYFTTTVAAELRKWSKTAKRVHGRRHLGREPQPPIPARPLPMSGIVHVPSDRTIIGTLIHALTLSLIAFNLAWGVYLMTVTYSMSIGLFFFSSLATLLPCVAAGIYFYSLTKNR
jgi:hypothetical protein